MLILPCTSAVAGITPLRPEPEKYSTTITLSPALKFLPQIRKSDCARSVFELHIQITGFDVPVGVAVGGGVPVGVTFTTVLVVAVAALLIFVGVGVGACVGVAVG